MLIEGNKVISEQPNNGKSVASSPKKKWKVQVSIRNEIISTENKYALLQDEVIEVVTEISAEKKLIVDKFFMENQDSPLCSFLFLALDSLRLSRVLAWQHLVYVTNQDD